MTNIYLFIYLQNRSRASLCVLLSAAKEKQNAIIPPRFQHKRKLLTGSIYSNHTAVADTMELLNSCSADLRRPLKLLILHIIDHFC